MDTTTAPSAAILSADLAPERVAGLSEALRGAGYGEVAVLPGLPPLERVTPDGGLPEYHLPEPLKRARLIVLDEWIGGRSCFELQELLRATEEGKIAGICLLLQEPADSTLLAAWASGCDICLTRETLNDAEFGALARRWREQQMPPEPGPTGR